MNKQTAQYMIEFVILITVILTAVMSMQTYVKRSLQSKIKTTVDFNTDISAKAMRKVAVLGGTQELLDLCFRVCIRNNFVGKNTCSQKCTEKYFDLKTLTATDENKLSSDLSKCINDASTKSKTNQEKEDKKVTCMMTYYFAHIGHKKQYEPETNRELINQGFESMAAVEQEQGVLTNTEVSTSYTASKIKAAVDE